MKTVLVTGSAGFIGSFLTDELLTREPDWPDTVRRLAERLEAMEPYTSPVILAAVVVG